MNDHIPKCSSKNKGKITSTSIPHMVMKTDKRTNFMLEIILINTFCILLPEIQVYTESQDSALKQKDPNET